MKGEGKGEGKVKDTNGDYPIIIMVPHFLTERGVNKDDTKVVKAEEKDEG